MFFFNKLLLPLKKARIFSKKSAGFTLIEILVAITVLSICLVVIMELFAGGLKNGMLTGKYTSAVFHARAIMEEFLLSSELTPGDHAGDFEDGFTWNVQVYPVESEDSNMLAPLTMLQVSVDVSWKDGEKKRHVRLNTLQMVNEMSDTQIDEQVLELYRREGL